MGAAAGKELPTDERELLTREFHNAVRVGDVERMKSLLEKESTVRQEELVNVRDEDGEPPILVACRAGHTAAVQFLLSDCSADPNQAGRNGWTALMLSCQLGHVAHVQQLLAIPSTDVNQGTGKVDDGTPLLWCRTEELRALLICRGAVLSDAVLAKQFEEEWARRNSAEKTAEHLANETLRLQRAARVPPEGTGRQIIEAAKAGDLERLRPLLQEWSGHSVCNYSDPADNGGYTALLWACARGNYGATELLLSSPSVDANKANNSGHTPLLVASGYSHLPIVILLTQNQVCVKGSINRPSLDGKTPLSVAVSKEVKGVLVANGANK